MLTDEARVITSASKPYKIMHTNAAWSRLTGFKFTEAAGQTCALLQGPKTEESVLSLLEASITAKQPLEDPRDICGLMEQAAIAQVRTAHLGTVIAAKSGGKRNLSATNGQACFCTLPQLRLPKLRLR